MPVTGPERAVADEISVPDDGAANPVPRPVPSAFDHVGTYPIVLDPGPTTEPPEVAALMTPAEIVIVEPSGLTMPKDPVVAKGRSAATRDRKDGVPLLALGAAKTEFAN